MNRTAQPALVLDPICGMSVDPNAAAGTSTYAGRTYAFCSTACQKKFDAAPERYVGANDAAATSTSCCGGSCH